LSKVSNATFSAISIPGWERQRQRHNTAVLVARRLATQLRWSLTDQRWSLAVFCVRSN